MPAPRQSLALAGPRERHARFLIKARQAINASMIISRRGRGLAPVLSLLPADHPGGTGATVTLVSLERASNLHEPVLSTFIVAHAPGGSAVLHCAPSSGYVL